MPIKAPTSKKKPAPRKKRTLKSVARKKVASKRKKTPAKDQDLLESVWVSPEITEHKSVTDEVLQKLRLYFSLWFSDEKACFYANISTSTLYNYQKKFPCFLEEKKMLKETLTDQAQINIAREIKWWSTWDSWKWLEKKLPTEFWNKLWLQHSGGIWVYSFTSNLKQKPKQKNNG